MFTSSEPVITKRAPDSVSTDRSALKILCTKRDGVSCSLLKHRRDLNEILLGASLELQEDRRGKSRGDVLIACVQASTCGHAVHGSGEASRKAEALDLFEHLLAEHRCITAVELNLRRMGRCSLLSALKRNRSLKSITICGAIVSSSDGAFLFEVLSPIPQLEDIAFKVHQFENERVLRMLMSGMSLDSRLRNLTALDVSDLRMDKPHASLFIRKLIRNKSIAELAVAECVFGYRDEASNALFATYLAHSTLRKLTLKPKLFSGSVSLLMEIIDAICKMKTLQELNADIVVDNALFISTVTLFVKVITQSATLRRLRLPSTLCECLASFWYQSIQFPDPQAAACMKSLCEALRESNSSLSQLTIDLRTFGEAECHDFFGAIARNDAMKSVVVNSLPCINGLDRVSTTIRERGLDDRVVIKGLCIHDNTKQLQQCRQIYNATIRASSPVPNVAPSVITALRVVSGREHVTSLRVDCYGFKRDEFSALAACIRDSSALSEVDIDLSPALDLRTNQELRDLEQELVSALASNLKLVRVNVKGALLSWDDLNVLARGATKSLCLTEFTATPACIVEAMRHEGRGDVRRCSIHKAEALTEASKRKDSALLDILEVTKKNASTILDAAQFVRGEKAGVEGIRAIELMKNHPRFLEMVREEAEVTKTEAKKIIRRALLRAQSCSLDEFMKMVGVVKDAVECPSDAGLRLQLVDLNPDCWLHIRSFLKIADVLPK